MSAMIVGTPVLVFLVVVALIFDFLNGLHDSAYSIATIVSTRVLSPVAAVGWAAFFNFIAFTVFGLHVAATMGSGVIHSAIVDPVVIFAALFGAIAWNLLTWWLGISLQQQSRLGGRPGRRRTCKGGIVRHRLGRPPQDRRRDRALTFHGAHPGDAAGPCRVLAMPPIYALRRRPTFPLPPTRLLGAPQSRPRW